MITTVVECHTFDFLHELQNGLAIVWSERSFRQLWLLDAEDNADLILPQRRDLSFELSGYEGVLQFEGLRHLFSFPLFQHPLEDDGRVEDKDDVAALERSFLTASTISRSLSVALRVHNCLIRAADGTRFRCKSFLHNASLLTSLRFLAGTKTP
jgi:hypothetical protein